MLIEDEISAKQLVGKSLEVFDELEQRWQRAEVLAFTIELKEEGMKSNCLHEVGYGKVSEFSPNAQSQAHDTSLPSSRCQLQFDSTKDKTGKETKWIDLKTVRLISQSILWAANLSSM